MALNREKLRQVVCLVIDQTEPELLGRVKLHKILYYADMLTYLATGNPMTGAVYRKRPFGPTCDALLPLLSRLEEEGTISVEEVDYHGYKKQQFGLLTPCNYSDIRDEEASTIRELIDFVCLNNTAKTISDFSHDIVWDMVEFGQPIPYFQALNLIPHEVSDGAMAWASSEHDKIANERPVRASALEGREPTPLRKRVSERA